MFRFSRARKTRDALPTDPLRDAECNAGLYPQLAALIDQARLAERQRLAECAAIARSTAGIERAV